MGNRFMSNLYPYYGHAPSMGGRIVLLKYVVIDRGQLVAWSVVSGGM